jgi:4-amino-4-deoxy-L-arabinose transferase-like glycosyltransferase
MTSDSAPTIGTPALIASLLLCVAVMAMVRWHTYDEPLEMDAATYAVIARELRAGRHLYTDLWDHKPPAVHVTFAAAQVLAGTGPAHIFLLGLGTAVATLLGVYLLGAGMAGRGAGLLAAVFWAVTSADLGLQANQPNTEVFMNATLVWACALLYAAPVARLALARVLAVGALLAAASLYKHVAAVPAAALLAGHLLVAPRRGANGATRSYSSR